MENRCVPLGHSASRIWLVPIKNAKIKKKVTIEIPISSYASPTTRLTRRTYRPFIVRYNNFRHMPDVTQGARSNWHPPVFASQCRLAESEWWEGPNIERTTRPKSALILIPFYRGFRVSSTSSPATYRETTPLPPYKREQNIRFPLNLPTKEPFPSPTLPPPPPPVSSNAPTSDSRSSFLLSAAAVLVLQKTPKRAASQWPGSRARSKAFTTSCSSPPAADEGQTTKATLVATH